MLKKIFGLCLLLMLLQACASNQLEDGADSNAMPGGEQSDLGDSRGLDPCRINDELPVCHN